MGLREKIESHSTDVFDAFHVDCTRCKFIFTLSSQGILFGRRHLICTYINLHIIQRDKEIKYIINRQISFQPIFNEKVSNIKNLIFRL